jgi:tagatose 1,6-diphosphate aldolase
VFTTAETRALQQLTTSSGRLAVVAADQRTSLAKVRGAAGLPTDEGALRDFKHDLVEALAAHAPAVLLDPEIALPSVIEDGALPGRTGLLVSLERSGPPLVGSARPAELLPDLGAAGIRARRRRGLRRPRPAADRGGGRASAAGRR